jgi:hypothetical protein
VSTHDSHGHPSPRTRRVRRGLAGLLAGCALLGTASAGVPSVEARPAQTGDELFGTYTASSRANGVQVTYDAEGLFPVSPVMQTTVPEALATLSSGPSGYALASLAYPGPLVADLGTVIALTQEDAPDVPPYPVRQEAFFPTGPTTATEGSDGGPVMRARTRKSSSSAVAHYAASDDPAAPVTFGKVTSRSSSEVLDGRLVSRARSEVTDVVVLGGVLTIDSVVTDIVAVHDGEGGGTDGRTVATGVRFLGLDARLTRKGIEVEPAGAEPPPETPLGELPDPPAGLGDLAEPLEEVTGPLNDGAEEVQRQAMPPASEALAEAGIKVRLMQPRQVIAPGSASRNAGGLVIDFRYEGRNQAELNELVRSIPAELRQSLGPVPNPVNMLVENHITGVAVAPASVTASAAPLFLVDIPEFVPPVFEDPVIPPVDGGQTVPATVPTTSGGSSGGRLGGSGFETALPGTDQSGGGRAGGSGTAGGPGRGTVDAVALESRPVRAILTGAVPAFLALVLLGLAPLFASGSTKLADAALAPTAASCPFGRDRPDVPRE